MGVEGRMVLREKYRVCVFFSWSEEKGSRFSFCVCTYAGSVCCGEKLSLYRIHELTSMKKLDPESA